MPILVLEGTDGGLRYQCRCDRCDTPNTPSEIVEEAARGYYEHAHGVYVCEVCEFLQLPTEPPPVGLDEQVVQMIDLIQQRTPSIDMSPGTTARTLIETALMRTSGDPAFISSLIAAETSAAAPPAPRTEPLVPLVRSQEPEPLSLGLQPILASFDVGARISATPMDKVAATPTELPSWCRPGQLVRRRDDGALLRVRRIERAIVVLADSVDDPGRTFPRFNRDIYFEEMYEPVEAKTRWDLLDEED